METLNLLFWVQYTCNDLNNKSFVLISVMACVNRILFRQSLKNGYPVTIQFYFSPGKGLNVCIYDAIIRCTNCQ